MNQKFIFRKNPKSALLIFIIMAALFFLSAMELSLFIFLSKPQLNKYFPYFHSAVSAIYFNYDRSIIQYSPECAQYHTELTYLLKPGNCNFSNREFNTNLQINSKGLRDDENSLVFPKIIVLGDSYAMGWGVQQPETFPQILEKKVGKKVLNAGMASFGTAREMLLLEDLQTDSLEYLIIQFSRNDVEENVAFIKNNFSLPITSEQQYHEIQRKKVGIKNYYTLFMFTRFFLMDLKEKINKRMASTNKVEAAFSATRGEKMKKSKVDEDFDDVLNPAKNFLKILAQFPLPQAKIIVVDISHHSIHSSAFIMLVDSLKNSDEYPDHIKNSTIVDTYPFLEKVDYFIIDDHINSRGHAKVANALAEIIQSSGTAN